MAKKPYENPMFTTKLAWLWLFCCPLALFLSLIYEVKIENAKRREKEAKRAAEFNRRYPDWWFWSN